MLAILERSARRLVPSSNVPTDVVEKQHPPLPAYESYVKGLLAETPATAITYLQNAIRAGADLRPRASGAGLDPERGGQLRGGAHRGAGDRRVVAVSARRPVRGRAGRDQPEAVRRRVRAAAADERDRADAGAAQRISASSSFGARRRRRQGRATYFLHKAVELNTMSADATFNLGYAYWQEQDGQASVYWLRKPSGWTRPTPTRTSSSRAALDATGAGTEGGRERELARRLSAGTKKGRPVRTRPPCPRVSSAWRSSSASGAGRTDSALVATEQREQREMATFHLDRGRRFYEREEDRAALTELRRADLPVAVPGRGAPAGRAASHLRAGRTREAIEALEDLALERGDGRSARSARRGLPARRRTPRPRTRKPSARWR